MVVVITIITIIVVVIIVIHCRRRYHHHHHYHHHHPHHHGPWWVCTLCTQQPCNNYMSFGRESITRITGYPLAECRNTDMVSNTHWFLTDVEEKQVHFQTHWTTWYLEHFPWNWWNRWVPQKPIHDKSTLVQVMAWCRQAASHYLSQLSGSKPLPEPIWPKSMSPCGVTRSHCVNWKTIEVELEFLLVYDISHKIYTRFSNVLFCCCYIVVISCTP